MASNLYFDASVLQYPQYRGVHVYAITLLREMANLAGDVRFHLHFGMTGWNSQLDDLLQLPNIRFHRYPGILGRHVVPPWNILRTGSTAYCLLNGNTGKIRTPVPCATAAVFHDMRLILYPEFYGEKECGAFAASAKKWLPKLDLLITGSHTVKQEIVDYFQIPASRVAVVSEGCEHRSCEVVPSRPLEVPHNRSFFLTVNPSDVRKNLRLTLDAFAKYIRDNTSDQTSLLVIAGVIANQTEYSQWRLNFPEAATRTITLGYVSEQELIYLYRNALTSIYVSFYEGFGIPVIEAYNEACPVILSDIPVFREVAGDAGIYVNPTDSDDLSKAMRLARQSIGFRSQYGDLGKTRAIQFRWKDSARVALDALLAL